MARMTSRPQRVTVSYRGLAYELDLVRCRRALVQRQIEGELYSMIFSPKWDKPTTGTGHDLGITYLVATGRAKGGDVTIRAAVVGPEEVHGLARELIEVLRIAMFCVGARTVGDLRRGHLVETSI